jgi:3-carboxy-cis,cis-muconate cycloisomerase
MRITGGGLDRRPALPLVGVFGDDRLAGVLSRETAVRAWIRVEAALVGAQADAGLLSAEDAARVVAALEASTIDLDALDAATLVVGFPILPLLEQLAGGSEIAGRYVHWGATTQDIMDTGLVLVLRDALARIRELVTAAGDVICSLAVEHRATMMAARTHARAAVPTTLGAKLAVWLGEFGRHLDRLDALESRLYTISLHGAGGTGAAFGPDAAEIRASVAARLGLAAHDVPWHASRDVIAEAGFVVAAMAATSGRIAREIVDLSRPEIGELSEAGGHHRGASSTMPQKANPISSETTIGFSVLATSGVAALLAALNVEHERSAGEWQIEWDALPTVIAAAGGSLLHVGEALAGLVVNPDRMRANMELDGGSIMAEAAMMALAGTLGRDRAHELVYEAVQRSRAGSMPLADALRAAVREAGVEGPADMAAVLGPSTYLGNASRQVDTATADWTRRTLRRSDG